MASARISVLVTVFLVGCGSPYRVVHVPQHEADLYPLSQTKAGVTIAVDEIQNPTRVERSFGADLIKEGILPVNVVVSNYGKNRVIVKPSDILLHRGKEIIDPLPVEIVVATAKRQHWFLHSKTEEEVDKFFENTTFKEMVLSPNDSYRGILFFASPPPKAMDRFFKALFAYRDAGPRLRVGLTDLETGNRMLFGPFSLSEAERSSYNSY